MHEARIGRREFALTLGAVTGGVAGCSSPFDDESETDEVQPDNGGQYRSEFPSFDAEEPTFRKWTAAAEHRDAFVGVHSFTRLRENKSLLPADEYESVAGWAPADGYIGIEFDEIETFLFGLGFDGFAYTTAVSPTMITGRLERTPYEQFEQRGSVSYYRDSRTEPADLLAVDEGGVITGRADRHGEQPNKEFLDGAQAMFEAAHGDRKRLYEESALYDQYTREMGQPLLLLASPPEAESRSPFPDGVDLLDGMRQSIQSGLGLYLTADGLVFRYWLRVTDDASFTAKRVEELYQTAATEGAFEEDGDVAIRRDGQVVDIAVVDPIENPGGGTDPPLVSLDLGITNGTVVVEHLAGDPLPLDRVVVHADEDIPAGSGALLPGERIRVEIGEADEVRVIYESPNSDNTSVIAEQTVGD